MGFITRIRFLPLTIFAATMLLTVKIGAIVEGVDAWRDGPLAVTGASAQQQPGAVPKQAAAPGAPKPLEPAANTQAATKPAAAAQPAPAQKTAPAPATSGSSPAPAAKAAADPKNGGDRTASVQKMFADDPTLLTPSEIDVLQRLAQRRDELDARDREIANREGLMRAAESRIQVKVTELKQLQATIEGLIKTYDQQQGTKMESLVKIYENMKPKDAARIFEELDMDTLLMVAERMNERRLSPIMATMDPAKAKDMTVELSRLRQLPKTVAK